MWSDGQADDKGRFLADLRALRDTAALGYDELAARAHYPSNILKEAENGPSLPGLPILAAYVRACGGDVPEWEERWRRLSFETRTDPSLPVRPAGASAAAVAGARAGIGVAPPDAYDPERIKAALRGSHVRADQAAQANESQQTASPVLSDPDGAAADTAADTAAGWGEAARTGWDGGARRDAGTSWDIAADQGSTANGNHHVWPRSDTPAGTAGAATGDPAATADALRRDPFSSSWLDDSQPIPPVPDTEDRWQDRPGTDGPSPEDEGQPAPTWRDFWTPVKAAAAPADVQRPDTPADEPTLAGTSWSAFTPSSPKVTGDPDPGAVPDVPRRAEPAAAVQGVGLSPADRRPELAQTGIPALAADASSAAPARSQAPGAPAVPQPASAPQSGPRDRFYPLRLLAVIVVAALIGSVLVLLLR
jgi:hypothetical protein